MGADTVRAQRVVHISIFRGLAEAAGGSRYAGGPSSVGAVLLEKLKPNACLHVRLSLLEAGMVLLTLAAITWNISGAADPRSIWHTCGRVTFGPADVVSGVCNFAVAPSHATVNAIAQGTAVGLILSSVHLKRTSGIFAVTALWAEVVTTVIVSHFQAGVGALHKPNNDEEYGGNPSFAKHGVYFLFTLPTTFRDI